MRKIPYILLCVFSIIVVGLAVGKLIISKQNFTNPPTSHTQTINNPLNIEFMRSQNYPGSDIVIEKTLIDGTNYHQYIASYKSEGLKIYALLTIPKTGLPKDGFPVIIFNHGYIAPQNYKTDTANGQYATYLPVFAKSGYVVFKPDYRGNGNSEGLATSAYYSPNYAIDDLNAIASIKKYQDVNPEKIGMWAHSMGGGISLRTLVVNTKDVKAAVIWNGVVGSYDDLINNWQNKVSYHPASQDLFLRNEYRKNLIDQYGQPSQNPDFWNSIDPTSFVKDIKSPIQIDTTPTDEEVPYDFSKTLYDRLKAANKEVQMNVFPNDNHNMSKNFSVAMQDSLDFFDKYLKN